MTNMTIKLDNATLKMQDALDTLDALEAQGVPMDRLACDAYLDNARDALNRARLDALLAMVDQCVASDAGYMAVEQALR